MRVTLDLPLDLTLDATYALDPQPTGVARYSQRLIAALAAANESGLNQPSLRITLAARPRRFARLLREYHAPFRRVMLQEPLNLLLPRSTDVFHGLNQRLPAYRFRRAVTTVHDVFSLSSNRYSSPDFRRKFGEVIRDAVRRSDAIITVSAYTRDELCRVTGADPARITVVHHGIDPPAPVEHTAAAPYFLTVGVVQTRKNTLAAVRAIERLPAAIPLVVAGGDGYGAEATHDYARRQGLADRVRFVGHCDEATLNRLYAGASALIFPSYEEGFGFPVLEAMARGLPVIAAHASSIPEIAGDAALLFDPDDDAGMAAACARILDDPAFAQDLSVRGQRQASGFTWERAAKETLAVYKRLTVV